MTATKKQKRKTDILDKRARQTSSNVFSLRMAILYLNLILCKNDFPLAFFPI